MAAVQLGLDNFLENHPTLYRNRRIGIVAHPASITSKYTHILPALQSGGAIVKALFGPEHGFGGEAQDMESVDNLADKPNCVQLISLYGKDEDSLRPPIDILRQLDALVIDLMDVGSRYYTFVWTAVLCLQACKQAGIQLIVLDRPNPLNGLDVEGAPQQTPFLSFVGLRPIPNRHGLTIGEIVRMAAQQEDAEQILTVIPLKGWRREMYYDDTGLPWVAPSPNMPTLNTAIVYPGGCLLEGTECSEGRGTTLPFELFGAPKLAHNALCRYLNALLQLPGVIFRPTTFKPMFQKHSNTICQGAQLHITSRSKFRSYQTGIAIIHALKTIAPKQFGWREAPYEFVTDIPAIDLLCGNSYVRQAIEQQVPLEDIVESWRDDQNSFLSMKPHFHLY